MTSPPVLIECNWCGGFLEGEEAENPRREGGYVICDFCWSDHYEFACYWCDEYEHIDHQDKLLVISEECGGLPSGVYEITKMPYFTSDYFNMWWNKECLKRIGDVPPNIAHDEDDYPSGHLCRACQKKAMPE